MDIRYSANQKDVKRYTTEELRDEFLIKDLYKKDEVVAVYSHVDRMLTVGIMPVDEVVPIDKGIDVWKNFGTQSFLERREIGFFNLGGNGVCSVDGKEYQMGFKDCIYIAMGTKEVTLKSDDKNNPARFFGTSLPAHKAYETKLIKKADAAKKQLGSVAQCNKRVVNQFIHPDVLPTCQLLMGLTELEEGSVWNTMPVHTHERRMEVYTYFEMDEETAVVHFMGEPQQTRHLIIKNLEAVISPSWSIHSGAGTGKYTFIWAMGGENQAFDDMDTVPTKDLK